MEKIRIRPEHFPKSTQTLFSVDLLRRWRALPVGSKPCVHWFRRGTQLNIGLVRGDARFRDEITEYIETHFPEFLLVRFYEIDFEDFRDVLNQIYGQSIVSESNKKTANSAQKPGQKPIQPK